MAGRGPGAERAESLTFGFANDEFYARGIGSRVMASDPMEAALCHLTVKK